MIIVSLAGSTYAIRNNPARLSFDSIDTYVSPTSKLEDKDIDEEISQPKLIIIKDIGVNLPIIPAKHPTTKWETTTEGVSYLESSPIPGQVGNSIMYGHDWGSLLGNLPKARPGMTIKIIYDNGTSSDFVITHTQEVTAHETSILKDTQDTRITIYTCIGLFDNKRFVVTAKKI